MPALALLSFLLLPLAEIAIFVCVGSAIGVLATLGLVLLAGLAGLAILRLQGLATLRRVRSELDRGAMPGVALFDGACLVFAGLLLIIPGFLTDVVALLLLLPPLRAALRTWLARRVRVKTSRSAAGGATGGPVIIEGDFTEVKRDEPATDNGKPSPWLRDTRGNA